MTENFDGQNVIKFYNGRKIQFQFFCEKKMLFCTKNSDYGNLVFSP